MNNDQRMEALSRSLFNNEMSSTDRLEVLEAILDNAINPMPAVNNPENGQNMPASPMGGRQMQLQRPPIGFPYDFMASQSQGRTGFSDGYDGVVSGYDDAYAELIGHGSVWDANNRLQPCDVHFVHAIQAFSGTRHNGLRLGRGNAYLTWDNMNLVQMRQARALAGLNTFSLDVAITRRIVSFPSSWGYVGEFVEEVLARAASTGRFEWNEEEREAYIDSR